MIDIVVARDKLAQFETADEIANFLREEGIVGYRRSNFQCPIANWLSLQTQQKMAVTHSKVGTVETLVLAEEGWMVSKIPAGLPNTDAMKVFIKKFDCGSYPELDAREVPQ